MMRENLPKVFSLPLAPAADDATQDRDQVLGQGRKIDREGRRDSNMKTQQPPQIAGLMHRVVVQGDDFVLSSLPKSSHSSATKSAVRRWRLRHEQRAVPRCEVKEQRAVPRGEMSSGRVAFAAR